VGLGKEQNVTLWNILSLRKRAFWIFFRLRIVALRTIPHIKANMVNSFNFSDLFRTLYLFPSDGFNVEESIDDADAEIFMLFQVSLITTATFEEFFIATDRDGSGSQSISRPKCWSLGILAILHTTPRLLTLTNSL